MKQIMCPSKELFIILAPCLIRFRRGLFFHLSQFIHTFHLFFYHLAMTTQYHRIHGQQDCVIVWPYRVRSQVMSPAPSLRSAVVTMHQGQVSAQHTIPVRTPRQHPCLRKSMRGKASECWLHRCSCRREKQVQSLREFSTLQEKVLCRACHTFQARRNLLRCTHTNGSRAET